MSEMSINTLERFLQLSGTDRLPYLNGQPTPAFIEDVIRNVKAENVEFAKAAFIVIDYLKLIDAVPNLYDVLDKKSENDPLGNRYDPTDVLIKLGPNAFEKLIKRAEEAPDPIKARIVSKIIFHWSLQDPLQVKALMEQQYSPSGDNVSEILRLVQKEMEDYQKTNSSS